MKSNNIFIADGGSYLHYHKLYFQLYGEKWNSSAPKFAANLGMIPLEPMKLNTTISSDTSDNKSTLKIASDLPAAQFDWNTSGLINPLDGMNNTFSINPKIRNAPIN